ncbi:MAG: hypothetical protein ABR910_08745 [Acidobacteriaceae bacterium]
MATLIVSPGAPTKEAPARPPTARLTPPQAPASGSSTKAEQLAQAGLLVILFAAPALMCIHGACANDPDIWWHLRTGEWILNHHAVPHFDPFSRSSAPRPWAAYSWLFEVVVLGLFRRLGLMGLVAYSAAMVLAITVALHYLIRRLQADFSFAVLLTFAASFTMMRLYTPRPWLFSVLFFVLVLDIVMQARLSGRNRELAWLPLIFALWANTHIQFVAGFLPLALALGESMLARRWTAVATRARPAWLGLALLGSLLGTLLNPYGWHIYRVVYEVAAHPGGMDKISELQALPFRSLTDYLVLLFAMGSAAVLARAKRLPLFEAGLLAFGVYISFRSQRDLWLMVIVGAAILAREIPGREKNRTRVSTAVLPFLAALTALAVVAGFPLMRVNDAALGETLAETMPVAAVVDIQAHHYPGPLFNDFNWGGYLVWALRMPVAIDGRGAMYGDEAIDRSVATWNAEPDWAADTQLASAGVVIGPVKAPLTQVLRLDPRWKLAYEDKLAAVFVRRK